MSGLPPMLKQGDPARLFPVLADTSRENRLASILLSLIQVSPGFAEALFGSFGLRIGKRSKIETFTEIVLNDNSEIKNRPDGLIVVSSGKSSWSALVEAKIGKAELEVDQVSRYIDAAKANKIDAVLTISNQFVARADVSPLILPKAILKKAALYHWSWTWIRTQAKILLHKNSFESSDERFMVAEFVRLVEHPNTGVERFTQMSATWKDVVQNVTNQQKLRKNSPEVEDAVSAWHSEVRDLSLQLSRHIGQAVEVKIERKHKIDATERHRDAVTNLIDSNRLDAAFIIPDGAADLVLNADIATRSLVCSMRLKAPQDRKSTKARLNWLLRMIKSDDPRIIVRAHWLGRKDAYQKEAYLLRESPDLIDPDGASAAPVAFEVIMIDSQPKRFAGRRTFIEDLERIVPEFYDLVGQHLRAWQAPPPKPISQPSLNVLDDFESADPVEGNTDEK